MTRQLNQPSAIEWQLRHLMKCALLAFGMCTSCLAEEYSRYELRGHKSHVIAVVFSHDGKYLATGGQGKCVRLWNVATRTEFAALSCRWPINQLAFSADGKTLLVQNGDVIDFWDLATLRTRKQFKGSQPVAVSGATGLPRGGF